MIEMFHNDSFIKFLLRFKIKEKLIRKVLF